MARGSVVYVPAGVTHKFHHISEDLRVLVVFSPPEAEPVSGLRTSGVTPGSIQGKGSATAAAETEVGAAESAAGSRARGLHFGLRRLPLPPTAGRRAAAGAPDEGAGMRGGASGGRLRSAQTTSAASTVVTGTEATSPMEPTSVRTISSATSSLVATSHTAARDREEQQQRQRRARVGQHQRVDDRRDVVASDPHRRAVQLAPARRRVRLLQLPHGRCLGDRHIVEHAERADDVRPASSRPSSRCPGRGRGSDRSVVGVAVSCAQPMNSEPSSPISSSDTSVPSTATDVRAVRPWHR